MIEGWHDKDDYVILYEEQLEAPADGGSLWDCGALSPGFHTSGIKLAGTTSYYETLPGNYAAPRSCWSVREYLQPLGFQLDPSRIQSDARFTNRIKWYITPLVLGGDPSSEKNMTWLSLEQHVEAVKWWNETYRKMKGN